MTSKNFLNSNLFLNLSCTLIFLLSIFLRSQIDIGADTGIYLNLGKKIARGGKYYYDFFESNFPLSFYFYFLQYQVSQLLHLSPIILSEIVINSLALAAIFWSSQILKKTTIYQNKAHFNLLIISFFLGFFLRPYALQIGEFGTKTSLVLITLYPYLAFSFERKNPLTKKELIQRGCLMGLMPCIKPHYLILILFIELKYFFQKKQESHLDKFIMVLIGTIYLFLMLKFTPEFFEFIVPMWPKTYAAYDDFSVFTENLWRHLGSRIAIFSLIFLIFSRLKPDPNDKILILFFLGTSSLMLLENIGTVDQITVFFAAVTTCFLKFIFDLAKSKQILLSENLFIIFGLAFLPMFDLEMLPVSIFGVGGIVNIWWVLALVYPFILSKKSLTKNLAFATLILALFLIAILCGKNFGGSAYVAVNLYCLFVILFFFERKFLPKFSTLSIFVICSAISCLFYAYVSSIFETIRGGKNTFPNKLSDMVAYYSSIYAPQKTDGILMVSILNAHQFPLLNYLEKEDYQKYHVASIQANKGPAGSSKMFEINDLDQVFTLSYLFDDVKNQVKNPNVKVIFINNTPGDLDKKDRCLIGTLEYYFLDPLFKKLFLQNFHFENQVITFHKISNPQTINLTKEKSIFDEVKPTTVKVEHDFEVYVRNEKK